MPSYSIPVRVYIEDTDAGGIVYYANYLKFMERARTEWLRSMGIELDHWQLIHKTLFVVRSVNIDYLKPARFNDLIEATFSQVDSKRSIMKCDQKITRGDEILAKAAVTLVCVNADTLKPRAIPETIREAITVER